jgi:hypothetical protein
MAHWWELWSPGLQAIGVILVLVGAGLLTYEWRYGTKEPIGEPVKQTESEYALMIFSAYRHRRRYQIGFALVATGVILQFAVRGIGWIAARGFFS